MIRFFKSHPKFTLILIPVIVLGGAIFLYFNKPGESKILPPCFFHLFTGLYCPGCGSTRMFYSLAHLDIVTALRCNALAVILVLVLVYTYIFYFVKVFFPSKCILPDICRNPKFSKAILIATVLFWVLRNIPIFPFNLLSPISLV